MDHRSKSARGDAQGRPGNLFRETPFDTRPPKEPRDSLSALSRMVRAEDLSVVFQPIVHVDTFRVFAYEALVRCRAPDLTDPAALFERAAEEGCVGRLGRMVREVAVPLCGGRPLFLNLHPLELQGRWVVRPDDPMYLHDDDIYLEITESVPFSHFDLCRDVLRELRARENLHFVVDDLGAGYSNLKRIADLEPSVVKLDRSLVTSLTEGSRQQRLVANVARLCEDMGARVVAEGVETADEWKALRDTGVHYAQGYLFARPGFPLPGVTVPADVELASRNARSPAAPRPPPQRDTRTPTAPQPAAPQRDTRTPMSLRLAPPQRDARTPAPYSAPPRDTRTPAAPFVVKERDVRTSAAVARDTRTPTSITLPGATPEGGRPPPPSTPPARPRKKQ